MRLYSLASFVAPMALLLVGAAPDGEPTRSELEKNPDGWVDLLPASDPDLKNWFRVGIPPKSPIKEPTPWKLDVKTGVLFCDGVGYHDMLLHKEEQGDFVYHVEWRFLPVTSGPKGYNAGIYVRNSADGAIWHQAQTGGGPIGYLFGETPVDGMVKRVQLNKDVKAKPVKPAGEWNVFEVTCKGDTISLWANGHVVNEWRGIAVPRGFLGLESEGYKVEFKNVKIKK